MSAQSSKAHLPTEPSLSLDERLWVIQDANFNVTALVNGSGTVVERYAYDPYGVATVMNASWNVLSSSAYAWQYLHQGGRLDSVSGLYHFRNRDYSPVLGRWTSMDPIRYEAGDVNLYRSANNNPCTLLDPSGLLVIVDLITKASHNCIWAQLYPARNNLKASILQKLGDNGLKEAAACRTSLGAKAIKEANVKALLGLGFTQKEIDSFGILPGNKYGKSVIAKEAYAVIFAKLGEKLKVTATISASSASSIPLDDTYEFKIYQNGDEHTVSVVTLTDSIKHKIDALNYINGYPINIENAERYLVLQP